MLSLLLYAQRAIAEPIEITKSPNIKVYAFEKVLDRWGDKQWSYFSEIVYKESNWETLAKNPKSSACGLGQTMMSLHGEELPKDFCSNAIAQIDWTIDYIDSRYDTPQKALQFWNKNKYY